MDNNRRDSSQPLENPTDLSTRPKATDSSLPKRKYTRRVKTQGTSLPPLAHQVSSAAQYVNPDQMVNNGQLNLQNNYFNHVSNQMVLDYEKTSPNRHNFVFHQAVPQMPQAHSAQPDWAQTRWAHYYIGENSTRHLMNVPNVSSNGDNSTRILKAGNYHNHFNTTNNIFSNRNVHPQRIGLVEHRYYPNERLHNIMFDHRNQNNIDSRILQDRLTNGGYRDFNSRLHDIAPVTIHADRRHNNNVVMGNFSEKYPYNIAQTINSADSRIMNHQTSANNTERNISHVIPTNNLNNLVESRIGDFRNANDILPRNTVHPRNQNNVLANGNSELNNQPSISNDSTEIRKRISDFRNGNELSRSIVDSRNQNHQVPGENNNNLKIFHVIPPRNYNNIIDPSNGIANFRNANDMLLRSTVDPRNRNYGLPNSNSELNNQPSISNDSTETRKRILDFRNGNELSRSIVDSTNQNQSVPAENIELNVSRVIPTNNLNKKIKPSNGIDDIRNAKDMLLQNTVDPRNQNYELPNDNSKLNIQSTMSNITNSNKRIIDSRNANKSPHTMTDSRNINYRVSNSNSDQNKHNGFVQSANSNSTTDLHNKSNELINLHNPQPHNITQPRNLKDEVPKTTPECRVLKKLLLKRTMENNTSPDIETANNQIFSLKENTTSDVNYYPQIDNIKNISEYRNQNSSITRKTIPQQRKESVILPTNIFSPMNVTDVEDCLKSYAIPNEHLLRDNLEIINRNNSLTENLPNKTIPDQSNSETEFNTNTICEVKQIHQNTKLDGRVSVIQSPDLTRITPADTIDLKVEEFKVLKDEPIEEDQKPFAIPLNDSKIPVQFTRKSRIKHTPTRRALINNLNVGKDRNPLFNSTYFKGNYYKKEVRKVTATKPVIGCIDLCKEDGDLRVANPEEQTVNANTTSKNNIVISDSMPNRFEYPVVPIEAIKMKLITHPELSMFYKFVSRIESEQQFEKPSTDFSLFKVTPLSFSNKYLEIDESSSLHNKEDNHITLLDQKVIQNENVSEKSDSNESTSRNNIITIKKIVTTENIFSENPTRESVLEQNGETIEIPLTDSNSNRYSHVIAHAKMMETLKNKTKISNKKTVVNLNSVNNNNNIPLTENENSMKQKRKFNAENEDLTNKKLCSENDQIHFLKHEETTNVSKVDESCQKILIPQIRLTEAAAELDASTKETIKKEKSHLEKRFIESNIGSKRNLSSENDFSNSTFCNLPVNKFIFDMVSHYMKDDYIDEAASLKDTKETTTNVNNNNDTINLVFSDETEISFYNENEPLMQNQENSQMNENTNFSLENEISTELKIDDSMEMVDDESKSELNKRNSDLENNVNLSSDSKTEKLPDIIECTKLNLTMNKDKIEESIKHNVVNDMSVDMESIVLDIAERCKSPDELADIQMEVEKIRTSVDIEKFDLYKDAVSVDSKLTKFEVETVLDDNGLNKNESSKLTESKVETVVSENENSKSTESKLETVVNENGLNENENSKSTESKMETVVNENKKELEQAKDALSADKKLSELKHDKFTKKNSLKLSNVSDQIFNKKKHKKSHDSAKYRIKDSNKLTSSDNKLQNTCLNEKKSKIITERNREENKTKKSDKCIRFKYLFEPEPKMNVKDYTKSNKKHSNSVSKHSHKHKSNDKYEVVSKSSISKNVDNSKKEDLNALKKKKHKSYDFPKTTKNEKIVQPLIIKAIKPLQPSETVHIKSGENKNKTEKKEMVVKNKIIEKKINVIKKEKKGIVIRNNEKKIKKNEVLIECMDYLFKPDLLIKCNTIMKINEDQKHSDDKKLSDVPKMMNDAKFLNSNIKQQKKSGTERKDHRRDSK